MGKGIKYGLCVLAGAVVLAVATATVPPPDGFRMGRNMEVLVNMLRDISLFYVDDVDPDELLSDAAAGMTAGLDPYSSSPRAVTAAWVPLSARAATEWFSRSPTKARRPIGPVSSWATGFSK